MATHYSILAWKLHRLRRLVGYSPWGHKESNTTEQLHFHFQRMYERERVRKNFLYNMQRVQFIKEKLTFHGKIKDYKHQNIL